MTATRKIIIAIASCAVALIAGIGVVGLFSLIGSDPGSRGYVMRDSSGQLVIGYLGCPDDSIENVEVFDLSATPRATLWKISRVGDARVSEIRFGTPPAGFRESEAFVQPIPNHTLRFEIKSTTGLSETVEFQVDKLPSGEFWQDADPKPYPISELRQNDHADC